MTHLARYEIRKIIVSEGPLKLLGQIKISDEGKSGHFKIVQSISSY